MRAVVQRVNHSNVTVDEELCGSIKKGLMVLLGVEQGDTDSDLQYMVDKITNLRIFEDDNEKMNLSLKDVQGELLVVSQFTLMGDCRKGRRPSFSTAARPDEANGLYEKFVAQCEAMDIHVQTGRFQEHMIVNIANDGPVTLMIDSKRNF